MDDLEFLYNIIVDNDLYTKSFEEFQEQYKDPAYQEKVFNETSSRGLYTNSFEEFKTKYKNGETEELSSSIFSSSYKPLELSHLKGKEEDLLASDPTNTIISNLDREGSDITFAEFNNTPEEKLQDILESKYGNWLEFDEPIVFNNSLRGANLDVIQITNPQTGATKDFELGTDYNNERGYYTNPKDSYNEMLEWITEQRRDKDGKYINEGAKRTLGEDYLVETGLGDLPLEVSTQIQDLALKEVKADETGELTMEQAIDNVVNTGFGKMNTAWRSSIVSQEAKENVKFNDIVEDMVKNRFLDIRFTENQIRGAEFLEQQQLLIELGVPEDVFRNKELEMEAMKQKFNIDPLNPNASAEFYLEKLERTLSATVKEQIEEYLNGSQQWSTVDKPNTLGPKIKSAYANAAANVVTEGKEKAAIENAEANTKIEDKEVVELSKALQEKKQINKSDADKLALDQITKAKADEIINNYTNEFSKKQFKQDWSMSDETKKKLDDKRNAILNESDPEKRKALQKELQTEIRDLLNDDNITFLKDENGDFVSKELQAKNVEAQQRKKQQLDILNDYLYKADGELTQELFSMMERVRKARTGRAEQGKEINPNRYLV